jgi:hypothetical protein
MPPFFRMLEAIRAFLDGRSAGGREAEDEQEKDYE